MCGEVDPVDGVDGHPRVRAAAANSEGVGGGLEAMSEQVFRD